MSDRALATPVPVCVAPAWISNNDYYWDEGGCEKALCDWNMRTPPYWTWREKISSLCFFMCFDLALALCICEGR